MSDVVTDPVISLIPSPFCPVVVDSVTLPLCGNRKVGPIRIRDRDRFEQGRVATTRATASTLP